QRQPYMIAKLTMLPPGSTWQSANCSLNSCAPSQPRLCTMTQRAQASTPPNPSPAIVAKATNSCAGVGIGAGMGAGVGTGVEAAGGGWAGGPDWPFFVNVCRLYSGCRRKPDMAINGRRNKPFGPGGSTRRLHPSPEPRHLALGFGGGEIGSTRA